MSLVFRVALLIVTGILATGCATGGSGTIKLDPTLVKADRIFYVLVEKAGPGCSVRVVPEVGGPVQVRAGWKVAWWLVNTCDETSALELSFVTKVDKTPKKPVTFQPFGNSVLEGKVKKKGIFSGPCQEFEEAPCTVYKYSVTVGAHTIDPDFEIIVY